MSLFSCTSVKFMVLSLVKIAAENFVMGQKVIEKSRELSIMNLKKKYIDKCRMRRG